MTNVVSPEHPFQSTTIPNHNQFSNERLGSPEHNSNAFVHNNYTLTNSKPRSRAKHSTHHHLNTQSNVATPTVMAHHQLGSKSNLHDQTQPPPALQSQSLLSYVLPGIVSLIFLLGSLIAFGIIIPYGFVSWKWKGLNILIACMELFFTLYSYWKGVVTKPGLVQPSWDRVSLTETGITLNSPSSALSHQSNNAEPRLHDVPLKPSPHTAPPPFASPLSPPPVQNTATFNSTPHLQMTHAERQRLLLLEPNHDRTPRYCDKCKCYKPPRAHHSTFYARCVLRYDHYCIWLNNTIGHANYRYFYLFLLYTVSSWLHFSLASVCAIWTLASTGDIIQPIPFIIILLYSIFMCPMGLLVAVFFLWHTWLLLTNQTSVEFHINGDVKRRIKKAKKRQYKLDKHRDFVHIYNTSYYNNIASVLGSDWKRWLIPVGAVEIGDGIRYDTIPDHKREALHDYLYMIEALPKDEDDLYDDYNMGGDDEDTKSHFDEEDASSFFF